MAADASSACGRRPAVRNCSGDAGTAGVACGLRHDPAALSRGRGPRPGDSATRRSPARRGGRAVRPCRAHAGSDRRELRSRACAGRARCKRIQPQSEAWSRSCPHKYVFIPRCNMKMRRRRTTVACPAAAMRATGGGAGTVDRSSRPGRRGNILPTAPCRQPRADNLVPRGSFRCARVRTQPHACDVRTPRRTEPRCASSRHRPASAWPTARASAPAPCRLAGHGGRCSTLHATHVRAPCEERGR